VRLEIGRDAGGVRVGETVEEQGRPHPRPLVARGHADGVEIAVLCGREAAVRGLVGAVEPVQTRGVPHPDDEGEGGQAVPHRGEQAQPDVRPPGPGGDAGQLVGAGVERHADRSVLPCVVEDGAEEHRQGARPAPGVRQSRHQVGVGGERLAQEPPGVGEVGGLQVADRGLHRDSVRQDTTRCGYVGGVR